MSTTVTYKGSTLTTVDNQIRTLKTAGKYMEGDVILTDTSASTPTIQPLTITPTSSQQIIEAGQTTVAFLQSPQTTFTDSLVVNNYIRIPVTWDVIPTSGSTLTTNSFTWSLETNYNSYWEQYQSTTIEFTNFPIQLIGKSRVSIFIYENYMEINQQIIDPIVGGGIGAVSISGTINVDGYAPITVNASSGSTINNQNKTITPTESSQSITADSGYTGLGTVTVNAISTTYVGSGITRRSSSDLTVSGATVTAPAGYYSAAASKSVASGSASAPSSISGTTATVSTGTNTLTLTKTVSVTPVVSAGYISVGTATNSSISLTANVTIDPTPTASGATVTIPAGYYTEQTTKSVSSGSATGPTSLSGSSATVTTGTNTLTLTKTGITTTPTVSAGYISSATASTATVTLTASVTTKAAATITPSTTNQTIAAGTYLTGTQTIAGDADLVASNIVSTANIFGVQGSVVVQSYYTGSSAPASSLGQDGDIYLQE